MNILRKKYVNDCVTDPKIGVAIPISDIMNHIDQKSTHNEGTSRDDFRNALQKIIDSDAMFSDKLDQIKALEATYPGMTVTYKDAAQSTIVESPYSLFAKTKNACEQRYSQNDQFAKNSSGTSNISSQDKVNRAKAALQELKTLNDGFASKLSGAILSQVLNCGGSTPKAGTCSDKSFDTGSDNFCLSGASQCATEIQGCYAEANNQVQMRQTKLQNLAQTYNANVAQMIARSNALYEQQKAAVTNMTKLIQTRFPEANFEIPKDMFVTTPEMDKTTYGVDMAGDGKINDLLTGPGSMVDKISLLKEMFKKQQTEVDNTIKQYIADQGNAMNSERGRWNDLYSQCKSSINGATQALNQQNNERQKAQGEQDVLVKQYCKKYTDLKNNPNGGCDKAKSLMDTMGKIIEKGGDGRISNNASGLVAQYDSACQALGNETTSNDTPACDQDPQTKQSKELCKAQQEAARRKLGMASSDSSNTITLPSLCPGGKDETFIKNIAKLSPGDAEQLKGKTSWSEVQGLLADGKLEDKSGFLSGISDLVGSDDSSKGICDKIKSMTDSRSDKALQENIKQKKDIDAQIKAESDKDKLAVLTAKKNALESDITSETSNLKENKATLDGLLSKLANANPTLAPTSDNSLKLSLNSIGQQADGSCDAQNNSMFPKNPFNFDLNAHDQQILGSSGLTK